MEQSCPIAPRVLSWSSPTPTRAAFRSICPWRRRVSNRLTHDDNWRVLRCCTYGTTASRRPRLAGCGRADECAGCRPSVGSTCCICPSFDSVYVHQLARCVRHVRVRMGTRGCARARQGTGDTWGACNERAPTWQYRTMGRLGRVTLGRGGWHWLNRPGPRRDRSRPLTSTSLSSAPPYLDPDSGRYEL